MRKRIKTGIYGGSFNPIHNGHTQLAEFLCREGYVDELWFLVSPQNPFKQSANDLLDDQARLELARLAIKENSNLHVSDFEFTLPRPSYTYKTLRALRQTYPDREFLLVIGADNWQAFDRWAEPEEIRAHHQILVYPRTGYPLDPLQLPEQVTAVPSPIIDLSSTELRKAIHDGLDASYGLKPDVLKEILARGYYQ